MKTTLGRWKCVEGCGACCQLDPGDRPDLEDYLTPEELEHYLSLIGKDGWCIHFDHETRKCSIYEQRPRFCRVQSDIFQQMYDIDPSEFNEFAIECCHQQIEGVYGKQSVEMEHYNRGIRENN
ncbi:YkgJ family cysteine cluster protein [Crocosphaera chwakensis]|uniref:YkgJ family cysteine cluster protein n=1 Tax=Crocosphaera chwakensis TaxID=2546361 RepID=UPI0002F53D2D|nr:YkgJ family cysteine cluster protein [Crocosphaera chwakensis]